MPAIMLPSGIPLMPADEVVGQQGAAAAVDSGRMGVADGRLVISQQQAPLRRKPKSLNVGKQRAKQPDTSVAQPLLQVLASVMAAAR